MRIPFKNLALGTRFSTVERPNLHFVKLSNNTIVSFNYDEVITCFEKPRILDFYNTSTEVIVRESWSDKNYHNLPITPYGEGYQHYLSNPTDWSNPYEEGTPYHEEWDNGFSDADWDDCE